MREYYFEIIFFHNEVIKKYLRIQDVAVYEWQLDSEYIALKYYRTDDTGLEKILSFSLNLWPLKEFYNS
jgi:hypothetical protein